MGKPGGGYGGRFGGSKTIPAGIIAGLLPEFKEGGKLLGSIGGRIIPLGIDVGSGRGLVNYGILGGSSSGFELGIKIGLLTLTGMSYFYSLELIIGAIASSTFDFSYFSFCYLGYYFSSFSTNLYLVFFFSLLASSF